MLEKMHKALILICHVALAGLAHAQPSSDFKLNNAIRLQCDTPQNQERTLIEASPTLLNQRMSIERMEAQLGQKLSEMDVELRKSERWSDKNEMQFFKSLTSDERYQIFESQRSTLVKGYMEATEEIIASLTKKAYPDACKEAVILKQLMEALMLHTKNQWDYMLSAKAQAVAAASKSAARE
jgi:uncharacterized coiled-coil protein SlyX